MNEQEMADLLDRATRDLAPDVEALVAGGLRRGQVRRHRRQMVATVTSTVVAVLAIVVAGSQLLGPGGIANRVIDPAGSATPTVGPASPTISAPKPTSPTTTKARLAVTTEQIPTTFSSLEPGKVSTPSAKSGPDAAPVVDFTWNGFGIRVGITPDDYVTGRSVPDPARRCAEQAGGDPCRPGPDGTVISTTSVTNPTADGGTDMRSAWVFRPDGWDVLVMAYNAPSKQGPVTADKPPFTLPELRRIATSDIWFR